MTTIDTSTMGSKARPLLGEEPLQIACPILSTIRHKRILFLFQLNKSHPR